jgi:hypothetical protein
MQVQKALTAAGTVLRAPSSNSKLMKNQTKSASKRGPKDRSYVNSSEKYEVKHEPKRKSPAKKFGSGK